MIQPQVNNLQVTTMTDKSKISMKIATIVIENAKEEYSRKMTASIKRVFVAVGKGWQEKHPKRHLKLVAGMGQLFWTIDYKILHTEYKRYSTDGWYTIHTDSLLSCSWDGWKNCGLSDHEKEAQFEPLLEVLEWLNDILDSNDYMDKYLSDIDFKNLK